MTSHCYATLQDLMSHPDSPILDFYPVDFECDLNGKKADWEAVVKIPFIDEERLLAALKCMLWCCCGGMTIFG